MLYDPLRKAHRDLLPVPAIIEREGESITCPVKAYLATLAAGSSYETMRSALKLSCDILSGDRSEETLYAFPWHEIRVQHALRVQRRLRDQGYAPDSINRAIQGIVGVTRMARMMGKISVEDFLRICDLRRVRGKRLPAGRALAEEEVASLFRYCAEDSTVAGVRDAALLALFVGTGLRRSEVIALDLDDVDITTGDVIVSHGKGDNARMAYCDPGVLPLIKSWVDLRGDAPGPLFLTLSAWGRMETTRVQRWGVDGIIQKRCRKAGIPPATPHDFRRTFITRLLEKGVDLLTVQALAGHAQPETTVRYDRRPEASRREAVARLATPAIPRRDPLSPIAVILGEHMV